ncbi:MAG: septum formation protein Maf [Bacteroidales bacterium]|jgi:septum formation protein|nr:septum formation protein Maf [Bacteroidales bacterium]
MVLSNRRNFRIILGSASPRRKELLSMLGLEFTVELPVENDESYPADTPYAEIPRVISLKKSNAFPRPLEKDEVLITADTMVFGPGNYPLGKPKDAEDAFKMLVALSGCTHQVITGVTLRTSKVAHTFTTTTEVTFKELTEKEIRYYIDNYRPFDKAGAYAIQEWIGAIGITSINGSYFNVVGLPVQRVYEALGKLD